MPYYEHCGAKLYYEETGNGRALLFLHGAALNGEQWKHQVQYFSNRYRVITLDARGHGRSSLPEGKVCPDVFWQDVKALLDMLQIEKAVICGLSMGGHVALQTAIYAPERVEKLILIGAVCTNAFNLYERMCLPVNLFSLKHMSMHSIAWCIGVGLGKYSSLTKQYIKKAVESLEHHQFIRVWHAVTSMESRQGLHSIQCPTLILVGEHDSMTKRQQPYIHEQIYNSKLVIIPHAHHCTNLDNPKQVEKEIDIFLGIN